MAQLPQPFNPRNIDPTQGGGQLPIGRHLVEITGSDVKATKNNDGGYLQLNLVVYEGSDAGSSGAWRLNLYNDNEVVRQVSERQLSAICHVTGVQDLGNDSTSLHRRRMMVEVGVQKNNNQYTEIKRCFDIYGNEPNPNVWGPQAPEGQQQNNGFNQQAQQPEPAQEAGNFGQQQAEQPEQNNSGGVWGKQQTQSQANQSAWGGGQGQQSTGGGWGKQ